MCNKKYITFSSHKKEDYSSIYRTETYPVALNPLYVRNRFFQESNINRVHGSHNGGGKYHFKDIRINRNLFRDLEN